MIRLVSCLLIVTVAISLGGCPQPTGGNGNGNLNVNAGSGNGNSSGGNGNANAGNGNTNSSNSNANTSNANANTSNGNANASNGNANTSNNANASTSNNGNANSGGHLFLRSLTVSESTTSLTLDGSFGSVVGVVFVNDQARVLTGNGWTANQIEVNISPQDLGEVYVQVGDATSNSRWITGWDFMIHRTYQLFNQTLCPTCQAKMTYRFRMRGDVSPVEHGPGNTTPGVAANYGGRGATFSIDSVTGSWMSDGQLRQWSAESTSPVYYISGDPGTFIPGDGEWFSAFAGVDPANSRAVVAVSIDTDGYRVTNVDAGTSVVEHISDFGVYSNLSHPGTIVMQLSPSLNILAGSTQPDSNGNFWEWETAPVQSPPPPGS